MFRKLTIAALFAVPFVMTTSPVHADGPKGISLPSHMAIANPMIKGETWDFLRDDVVEDGIALLDGEKLMAFDAPVSAFDSATVPFSIKQRPGTERIRKITVLVDENPVPVVGEFMFGPLMGDIDFESRVRFDIYSNLRVVAETEQGRTFMAGRFVQAAGGCSAAVTRDIDVALATMGKMKLRHIDLSGGKDQNQSGVIRHAQLMIRHPMFTGMQVYKGTLNHIDPRFIENLEVKIGDELLFSMDGGFSISENPSFRFSYVNNGAQFMHVRAVDTDGAVFEKSFPINQGA